MSSPHTVRSVSLLLLKIFQYHNQTMHAVCLTAEGSVSLWRNLWVGLRPQQNKDKTMTKHGLGHKGASYLSTPLDTNLIYTNWSASINLCLWSVSGLLYAERSVHSVAATPYETIVVPICLAWFLLESRAVSLSLPKAQCIWPVVVSTDKSANLFNIFYLIKLVLYT